MSRVASALAGISIVLVGLGLFGGCSLGGLDGFSGGGSPQDEAGVGVESEAGSSVVVDAGSPGGESDGAADAEPDPAVGNLLTNGDFEFGCAGWKPYFGFTTEASVARSGTGSCRFCMDTNWEAFLEQEVDVPVKAGEKYAAEIWIRAAKPSDELSAAGLRKTSLYIDLDGTSSQRETEGPPVPSDTEWTRITALNTAQADGDSVLFEFRLQQYGNPAKVGNVICVYVDEAVLRKLE